MRPSHEIADDTAVVRFFDKFVWTGHCWAWTASKVKGHGQFWFRGRRDYAHRASYTIFVGEIPEELQIDHLCRNRACVNPQHLEAVTCGTNISRAKLYGNRCKRGHLVKGTNEYRWGGTRRCLECKQLAWRNWNASRRA